MNNMKKYGTYIFFRRLIFTMTLNIQPFLCTWSSIYHNKHVSPCHTQIYCCQEYNYYISLRCNYKRLFWKLLVFQRYGVKLEQCYSCRYNSFSLTYLKFYVSPVAVVYIISHNKFFGWNIRVYIVSRTFIRIQHYYISKVLIPHQNTKSSSNTIKCDKK